MAPEEAPKNGELGEGGDLRPKYYFSILLYVWLFGGGFIAAVVILRWYSEGALIMSLYGLITGLVSELRDLEKDGDIAIRT